MKWLAQLKQQIEASRTGPTAIDLPAVEVAIAHLDVLMPAIRRVYDDVGPPGHFGYHTREDKALQALYDAFNEALAGKRPASQPAPAPASSTNADQA